MKISYNWLNQLIQLPSSPQETASILTSIGLEVDGIEQYESIKGGLQGLIVGEILSCTQHPNSDHLHLTQVKINENEPPLQIVCGAPNVATGQKVIVAPVGTTLYDGDKTITIKPVKLRGIESFGMICAEDEIQIGTNHDGIIVLPPSTPVGMLAKDYYNVQSDNVFEIDITPNRSDALSHYGVARDLYAFFCLHAQMNNEKHPPLLTKPLIKEINSPTDDFKIQVSVENNLSCPRYSGICLTGIKVQDSPQWLKDKLLAIGLHPINNVVDVANYVMFEFGQPLHTFDADKIKNKHIIVRNAYHGEEFVTLDGNKRTLCSSDLAICNEDDIMCIAGIFGGKESGITATTTKVFIESAYFDPVSIRKTARRQGLSTDASFRYERGCDPNNTLYVLKRATTLLQECAGGQIAMNIIDVVNGKEEEPNDNTIFFPPFQTTLDLHRMWQLIGYPIKSKCIETALQGLEIEITKKNIQDDNILYDVAIPRYRTDVQRECDIVEDILRLYNYNNIPDPKKLNTSITYSPNIDTVKEQKRISEQLVAQGFIEILNNSLTKSSYYDNEDENTIVKLLNPLSNDLSVMRQTLLFGGLESISRNIRFKNTNLKFFEFGKTYFHFPEKSTYLEETHLALWITGNRHSPSWISKDEKVNFFQLSAYVQLILKKMGMDDVQIDIHTFQSLPQSKYFNEGIALTTKTKLLIGYIGTVKKSILTNQEIEQDVFYADILWDAILPLNTNKTVKIKELPKYPFVKRDLSFLFPKNTLFEDIKREILKTEKQYLKDISLFDVYEGKNIAPDKKSYAITFILQDEENTLVDAKIEAIMKKIQTTIEKHFNAILRG